MARMTKTKTRPSPGQLVLVRHGQSDWNQKNLFTGWYDVDLTAQGRSGADVRHRIHVGARARDSDALADPRRDAADVDPGREALAPERAPLWRAPGTRQGTNGREARRRAGENLAAQL